jgi:tRNA/rRNA methyltransferase
MTLSTEKKRGTLPDGFSKGPVIVLIEPQMPENIGAAARAMLNCGLTELRLVRPRDGWPNPQAIPSSSGADWVLEGVKTYGTTEEAIADCHYVFATTARGRDMNKPVMDADAAALKHFDYQKTAILFGPERAGLANEDIVLADAILTVPLNPDYSSLNLAQAVLLVCHRWFLEANERHELYTPATKTDIADKELLINLFNHLEEELDHSQFFKAAEKRPIMVQNLRNMLQRAELSQQEIQTLHGILVSLTGRKRGQNT